MSRREARPRANRECVASRTGRTGRVWRSRPRPARLHILYPRPSWRGLTPSLSGCLIDEHVPTHFDKEGADRGMKQTGKKSSTTVGTVDQDVLAFTAGEDRRLDVRLIEVDCIGSAAHAMMLSEMDLEPPLLSRKDCQQLIDELIRIMQRARKGSFRITLSDQDVHLAVERNLTQALGDIGKKIHTGRSRNDQVAVDLRLLSKTELLDALDETAALCEALVRMARRHASVPMVGRTHMQPAMPSSVGLWASAHAESLLDDASSLRHAYALNDCCPLGSAAGYGVPLPIDRMRVSDLLGFSRPCHNVLYASQTRGKMELVILSSMSQLMLTLSRLSEDLILFSLPEFSYFVLPDELCTGSSIMPQKRNPDVLELVRAKSSRVAADAQAVWGILRALPSGYNRDLQEAKEPFFQGLDTTRACLRILTSMVQNVRINRDGMERAFTPDVFATDKALEYVASGMPFRDAYHKVKGSLEALSTEDPHAAVARKQHYGGTAGLDFGYMKQRVAEIRRFSRQERKSFNGSVSKLLGIKYPEGIVGN